MEIWGKRSNEEYRWNEKDNKRKDGWGRWIRKFNIGRYKVKYDRKEIEVLKIREN